MSRGGKFPVARSTRSACRASPFFRTTRATVYRYNVDHLVIDRINLDAAGPRQGLFLPKQ